MKKKDINKQQCKKYSRYKFFLKIHPLEDKLQAFKIAKET